MDAQTQNTMCTYLQNTMDPNPAVRKPAENYLQSVETNSGYGPMLTILISKDDVPIQIRIAGSITLKNFVKRHWRIIPDCDNCLSDPDRSQLKSQLVPLMLNSPESIQRQISECISLIGREDFPNKWTELLPELITQLTSDDFSRINACLQTVHSLCKRYRHEMKSEILWREIKYVLDTFCQPLTALYTRALEAAKSITPQSPIELVRPLFDCLTLMAKIFYDLNAQDIPEFFEDNMQLWMGGFLELLKMDVQQLKTADEVEDPGLLEQLRGQICDNIAMYAMNYDEEVGEQKMLQPFVEVVWQLLVATGSQPKYDLLVSNAITFLANVCGRDQYKELFEAQGTLAAICENVVVPNMAFRESDQEQFEDNPEEFIRKDIEGSDVDTRRRAAADLVRALCRFFEPQVIQIFSAYIQHLLGEFSANPTANWAKKDVSIYLVTSLASRGQTAKHGSTKTSQLVDLSDFFSSYIAPHLGGDVNELPVLKADALKYLVTFRNQLNKELVLGSLKPCAMLLKAESVVVRTYAAHAFERVLMMRDMQTKAAIVKAEHLEPITTLLESFFGALELTGTEESEYIMKAICRVLTTLQAQSAPYVPVILQKLTHKLRLVAKNPSKPHFNHYLFESLCALIKHTHASVQAEQFESSLFPPFQDVLQLDVTEFMPYVFQVLGLMLNVRQAGAGAPESYMALFPFLLVPVLWEKPSNIPGLVKLLQAYVRVASKQIISGNHLNALLGIFQKLVASKSNDQHGFYLLNSMIEFMDWSGLSPSIKSILLLLLNRLQTSRTVKFARGLNVCLCLLVVRQGASALIGQLEAIQSGLYQMIVEKVMLRDMQKVNGSIEKKICCVGVTKLLAEAPEQLGALFPQLLQSLVALFELPEEDSTDDDQFIDVESIPGYSAAYSQLAFASSPETDPTGVQDPKLGLAKALEKLAVAQPTLLSGALATLDPNAKQFIDTYARAAGVSLGC